LHPARLSVKNRGRFNILFLLILSELYSMSVLQKIRAAGMPCAPAALLLGAALYTSPAFTSPVMAEMMVMPSDPTATTPAPAQDIPVDPATVVYNKTGKVINIDGEEIGTVKAAIGPHGTMLDISVSGLAPGKHGMHMHAIGLCNAATGFKSAGGHINPGQTGHGLLYADGPHAGDLPNLIVGADGTATTQVFSHLLTLDLLDDEDGAALIIHAGTDDHLTQPLGGSGGRVACSAFATTQ